VKALQIAESGLLASHELTEQELKIETLTLFSFLSLSPTSAATVTSSWWEASASMGNMYPCCFGPMLLALHARLEVGQIQGGLGNKGLKWRRENDLQRELDGRGEEQQKRRRRGGPRSCSLVALGQLQLLHHLWRARPVDGGIADVEGAHHSVILVAQHVAVENVLAAVAQPWTAIPSHRLINMQSYDPCSQ
jgi:hypothetical protein